MTWTTALGAMVGIAVAGAGLLVYVIRAELRPIRVKLDNLEAVVSSFLNKQPVTDAQCAERREAVATVVQLRAVQGQSGVDVQ